MDMYRQGDVLLTRIEVLPEGLTRRSSQVIVEGEATGHQHRLVAGDVLQDAQGRLYLAVFQHTQVVHQDHQPLELDPGLYAITRQREYVAAEIDRTVLD